MSLGSKDENVQKYYHVPYDDVFEYVAVVVRARRHFHCLRRTLHRAIKSKVICVEFVFLFHLFLVNLSSLCPPLTQQSPKQSSLENF